MLSDALAEQFALSVVAEINLLRREPKKCARASDLTRSVRSSAGLEYQFATGMLQASPLALELDVGYRVDTCRKV